MSKSEENPKGVIYLLDEGMKKTSEIAKRKYEELKNMVGLKR